MPRWFRLFLTVWSFFLFFAGSPFLGIFVFPVLRLMARGREDHRRRVTRLVHRALRFFVRWITFSGLVACPYDVPLPEGIDPTKPYVLIANHPSLIDVVLLLAYFEDLTCVTKGSWSHSLVLGPFLRQTLYLPGRGAGDEDSEDVLGGMIDHVQKGHALLVFPEGTRSRRDRLNRLRRGAVEVAARAKVPLLAAFIDVDRPYLIKGVSPWRVPKSTARFRIEWLDVVRADREEIDPKALNQKLSAAYQERFARSVAERAES
jgi:1-acyl-sn-glycerol-3-phosphate acyltransferase